MGQAGAMAGDLKSLVLQLVAKLNDAAVPNDQRVQVAASLLAVRQMNRDICRPSEEFLAPAVRRCCTQIIEALGANLDSSIGALLVDAMANFNPSLQETVFTQLIKRSDSSMAMVEALKSGKIDLATLGPDRRGPVCAPTATKRGPRAPCCSRRVARAGSEGKERPHRRVHAGSGEAGQHRERPQAVHAELLGLPLLQSEGKDVAPT